MVIDRYKGYSVYRARDVQYRVQEASEKLEVVDERTGTARCTVTVFYNPKRILRPEDKETALADLLRPAQEYIRHKIDVGDLTDEAVHAEALAKAVARPQG